MHGPADPAGLFEARLNPRFKLRHWRRGGAPRSLTASAIVASCEEREVQPIGDAAFMSADIVNSFPALVMIGDNFANDVDVLPPREAINSNRPPLVASLKDLERYFGKVVSHDALKAVA